MTSQHTSGTIDRRDVLKGLSAAGVGAVGATAISDRARGGTVTGGCAVVWPDPTEDKIDLGGGAPVESGDVPDSGDLVIFVHGYFGEDLIDSIDVFNGSNQATALALALEEQGIDTPVVAGMWEAITGWSDAKSDAETAGENLAAWVDNNGEAYDTITVFGHSLGSRVTLEALNELADRNVSVTSAGLLGPGVDYETVCDRYAPGIESAVDDAVYNYYSGDDDVVCYLYPLAEQIFESTDSTGLGCEGSGCVTTPENVVDVNLTGEVLGHCNYFKPSSIEHDGDTGAEEIASQQLGYLLGPDDGTIAGTVTADGDPLADATVEIASGGEAVTTATTDNSGAFAVDLAPGTYSVHVDRSGFRFVESQTTVTENETASVTLDLQSVGAVAGFVTNTRDEPLGGVVIECVDPETGATVQTATTDENGQYTMELPTDTYEMTVDEEGFAPADKSMTVEAGITTQVDIDLHLPPVVGDTPPKNLDGDGLYRDVRGDGNFTILDVQALFNNLDDEAVQSHADAYNFYGDDDSEVTILDVQALFNDLQKSDEPGSE